MTVEKVQSGSRLRIKARDWNQIAGVVNAATSDLAPGSGPLTFPRTGVIVPIRNGTGQNLPPFSILGIDGPGIDPSTDLAGFQRERVFEGVAPSEPAHRGRFVILLEPAAAGAIAAGLIAGPCPVQLDAASGGYADVADGLTTHLKPGQTGTARVLWRAEGEGLQWGYVLLGCGADGPKLCDSDEWGGIGPAGGEGANVTPQEGDAAGDVVSGTGHMFNEEIDWGDPPDEEDMPSPSEGGMWNPQVSMNLGKWLREHWIPDNAGAIITALGDTFNTAISTAVNTYMTEHAGDVVGPAITVWLGDNITTIVTNVVDAILDDPGALFCMDENAPVAIDATGNRTNAQHIFADGHQYTDPGGVLNPRVVIDPTAIFCTGDGPNDLTLAALATGSDSTGMVMVDGHLFWDQEAGRYNIAAYIDPTKMICVHEPNGDEITAGSKHIKGFNYWDDAAKVYNPFIPFPDGDDTWIEVDAANGLIKHKPPGPEAFAWSNACAVLAGSLDEKGHVRWVTTLSWNGSEMVTRTIGPLAPQ